MDRNEMARARQHAVTQVRAQFAAFAQDFAAGKAVVLDRFASAVKEHDLVLWQPPHTMVYEVTKIEPILDMIPNQPIGMIRVTLEMMAPVNFLAGQPAMTMIVVGHQTDATNAELHSINGGRRDNEPEAASGPTYTPDEETSARQNLDAERDRLRAEREARDTPPPSGGGSNDGDTGD